MLSCFLNDAASGCLHWPKCANNFYDYDCDYHAAAPIPSYSPFVFEFAFACIFIMALAGKMHVPTHAHPHRADTKIYPWRPRPWLAARQLYEHVSFGSIADWLTGWLDGQLSFFPDSVPHPNHNNRAQISQYLSAKMLKQRLIILFHIFFFFFFACSVWRFSPLLAIKYI